ncbi:CDP-glucose 4,6-dehydratase [Planktomarina sp.]|nr:CDP-glucose 4,6-dehydratase [Planktomarina sp.]
MLKNDFWVKRRVFVTGSTGFKGSWLCKQLKRLGAEVYGYALPAETEPSLFEQANLSKEIYQSYCDIRNLNDLRHALHHSRAEIIFHLAAQPLVRESYVNPVETFETNVMGTVNILEASRENPHTRVIINVTTDKVYENREWEWGYRETDRLGGHDPYSASKACSEIVSHSYMKSLLFKSNIFMATARAGNVIGGGDYSKDRLVPDIVRAANEGIDIKIRNPSSIRPWQHVIEPIWAYLLLAQKIYTQGNRFNGSWNFGPNDNSVCDVRTVTELLLKKLGSDVGIIFEKDIDKHEANLLKLDISKSKTHLGWNPTLDLNQALDLIVDWNDRVNKYENVTQILDTQLEKFEYMTFPNIGKI